MARAKASGKIAVSARKDVVVDTSGIGTRKDLRVKVVDAKTADGAGVAVATANVVDATGTSAAGAKSMEIGKDQPNEKSGAIERIAWKARVAASAVSVAKGLVVVNNAPKVTAPIEVNALRGENAVTDRVGVVGAAADAGSAGLPASARTFASGNSRRIEPRENNSKNGRSL
jgi:hypothetical protein